MAWNSAGCHGVRDLAVYPLPPHQQPRGNVPALQEALCPRGPGRRPDANLPTDGALGTRPVPAHGAGPAARGRATGRAAGAADALAAADQPAATRARWCWAVRRRSSSANPDASAAQQVSRRHAHFYRDEHGELYVEDLDSANGTYIDGAEVAGQPGAAALRQVLRLAQDVDCDVLRLNEHGEPEGGGRFAMTHDFEPPTVWQPRSPGSPGTPQLPGDEPTTRLQRPRGSQTAEPGHRPPAPASASADPQTTLQRRTGPPADPPTRRQGLRPGQRSGPADGVLGELADRFEPVPGPDGTARLGAGAEAEVWLVRERTQGRVAALKLYRPNPLLDPSETFDVALRERLADSRLRAHVPELYGWGRAR